MKVTFDNDGYVEMLIMKGDLPNSVELPDDDTIDMKYLACYKLGYDGTQLVLDAKKVQRLIKSSEESTILLDFKNKDIKIKEKENELIINIEVKEINISKNNVKIIYIIDKNEIIFQIKEV